MSLLKSNFHDIVHLHSLSCTSQFVYHYCIDCIIALTETAAHSVIWHQFVRLEWWDSKVSFFVRLCFTNMIIQAWDWTRRLWSLWKREDPDNAMRTVMLCKTHVVEWWRNYSTHSCQVDDGMKLSTTQYCGGVIRIFSKLSMSILHPKKQRSIMNRLTEPRISLYTSSIYFINSLALMIYSAMTYTSGFPNPSKLQISLNKDNWNISQHVNIRL